MHSVKHGCCPLRPVVDQVHRHRRRLAERILDTDSLVSETYGHDRRLVFDEVADLKQVVQTDFGECVRCGDAFC